MSTIYNDPNCFNSLTSSIASSTIWISDGTSTNLYPFTNNTYTTSASITSNNFSFKKCRECNHGHIEGQSGCMDSIGFMVTFAKCNCKEYVPSDNLEYLEYLYNKKQHKETL